MLLTIAMVLVMMVFVVVAGDAGGYGCRCIVAGAVGVDDDDDGKTRQSSEVASLARVRGLLSIPTPELGSPCGTKLGGFTIFSEDSWRTEGTGNSQGLPCFPEQGSARPHPATHAAKFRDGNTLPQLLLLVHGETMHGEHGTSRCPDRQQLSLSKSRSQRFD